MKTRTDLLSAGFSDTGVARRENEDRIHVDAEHGIFIVADGLGGHAAGEKAAEIAVEMIVARLKRKVGSVEERIREAITVANNEILKLATENPEWKGMASVVTVAVIEDGTVTVGHVGDSRLYVLEPGGIRKVTHDHSPVGELEDSKKLTEAEAMAHARRNEVFRDLGSEPHGPDDEEFIEVLRFPFRPNMALLFCSDGLSDQVTSDQIRRSVEAHAGNPKRAVRELVQAANSAGGKDNVSVVLVEGPEYRAPQVTALPASSPVPNPKRRFPVVAFLTGIVAAFLLFAAVRPYLVDSGNGLKLGLGAVRLPVTWRVGQGGLGAIEEALAKAQPGDTVVVGPGTYREKVRLRPGVSLINEPRRTAVIEGQEVTADSVRRSRLIGFKIAGPGAVGLRIVNSEVDVTDVQITGMSESAIVVEGDSPSLIRACTIAENGGTGIIVRGAATPAITNNVVISNGKTPRALRPGIHVAGTAEPVIAGNVVADSGVEQIWASPLFNAESLAANNFLAPGMKDRKGLVKVVTR